MGGKATEREHRLACPCRGTFLSWNQIFLIRLFLACAPGVRVTRFGVRHARTVITEILQPAIGRFSVTSPMYDRLLVRNLLRDPIERRGFLFRRRSAYC